MKTQTIDYKLIAIFIGALLFNYLFWMERLALNMLLYSIFIFAIVVIDQKIKSPKKLAIIGIHLFSGILVVINNSDLTVFTWYLTLAVAIGFSYTEQIKSIFTAMLLAFLQIISAPFNLAKEIINLKFQGHSVKPLLKPVKYMVLPIIMVFVFTIIYAIANPVFSSYFEKMMEEIGNAIQSVFKFFFADLSIERFMHVVLGLLFTAGLLLQLKGNKIETAESKLDEQLKRQRRNKSNAGFLYEMSSVFIGKTLTKIMALKTENIVGIISFAMLNLLLLSLNIIDINTIWLAKTEAVTSYSAELHDGTNALIFSIILAMAVIIYFFSANLNFYSKNKLLKILAFLWILQNAFLVLSVLLRDFNYINMHGLTYKRIGVIVFLSLCTVGLYTVYIKVAKQKTFFYLLKTNTFIWYILLPLFGCFNWDVLIAHYNINNRNTITLDVDHLMELSDKTLPLLDKNRDLLKELTAKKYIEKDQSKIEKEKLYFDKLLDARISVFKERYQKTTWLSWNYRDWQTNEYFKD